jgi:KUP system potassium uptake protein
MAITSIIYFEVTRKTWRWPLWKALPLLLLFLSFDLPFFAANLLKLRDGGFVPLLVGAVLFVAMVTWKRGRAIYRHILASSSRPFDAVVSEGPGQKPTRSPGAGVFLSTQAEGFPPVVLNLVKRVHVLPETVVLLTMDITHVPRVPHSTMRIETIGPGAFRLVVERGFMDAPDVPAALAEAIARFALPIELHNVTYYIGRDTFLATRAGRMGRLSERLFALMARGARSPTEHFRIPPQQVVEIGSQIDL